MDVLSRSRLLSLVSLAGLLAGCNSTGLASPNNTKRFLGSPKSHANLTVFPVYGPSASSPGGFITLDEGLRSGKVTVTEHGEGGTVNAVDVVNRSGKPLFLLGGEVLLGGQQDRCLGESTVIPPTGKKEKIVVFCVEQGRWNGAARFDRSAGTLSGREVRLEAYDGAFKSASRPAAAQATSAAQQKVWDRVAQKAAAYSASTPSGTYAAVVAAPGGKASKAVASYCSALQNAFANDKRVIGVVAVIDGKPVAADVFGNSELFARLWPKLLKSYAMDAHETGSGTLKGKASRADATAFLLGKDSGSRIERRRTAAGENIRAESAGAVKYQLNVPALGGAAVHEGKLRK